MSSLNHLTTAKILAAAGLIFWAYYFFTYLLGAPLFLNTEDDNRVATQIGFAVYGYVVLLVGVMLGAVYQELKIAKAEGKKQILIGSTVRRATKTADFWLGMFASPVVYAVLLQAIDLTNVTIASFVGSTLVGLQNGFVCNTIADSLINNRPSSQGQSAQKSET
jgi:hypothetical protein